MKTPSLLQKLWASIAGRSVASTSAQAHSDMPQRGAALASLPELELVLGIDLGTSCTKVVIGDHNWKNAAYAVPYDDSLPGIAAYLHPTRLGAEANLKMRLMDDPSNPRLRELLAQCVAQIIRKALRWFHQNGPADYRRRRLCWSLSLGFPAKSTDPSPLQTAYDAVATRAVALASDEQTPDSRMRRYELYPEIAAQLAGYIKSPYRKAGNLLLIDVGAGTLDVSTLIIGRTGAAELVSFQVCKVADLGALRLHARRVEALEALRPGCVGSTLAEFQDGAQALPEKLGELVKCPDAEMAAAFEETDACFGERVLDTSSGCVAVFRKRLRECHEQSGVDPFGNNLRLMLTGGGSRSVFYQRLLAGGVLEERITRFTRWSSEAAQRRHAREGLLVEALPLPRDLVNLPSTLAGEFDRLSVAYGLAFGGHNLMQVMHSGVELPSSSAQPQREEIRRAA